jgi:hypothetical protein
MVGTTLKITQVYVTGGAARQGNEFAGLAYASIVGATGARGDTDDSRRRSRFE